MRRRTRDRYLEVPGPGRPGEARTGARAAGAAAPERRVAPLTQGCRAGPVGGRGAPSGRPCPCPAPPRPAQVAPGPSGLPLFESRSFPNMSSVMYFVVTVPVSSRVQYHLCELLPICTTVSTVLFEV